MSTGKKDRSPRYNQATLGSSLSKLPSAHAGPAPVGRGKRTGMSPAQLLMIRARNERAHS